MIEISRFLRGIHDPACTSIRSTDQHQLSDKTGKRNSPGTTRGLVSLILILSLLHSQLLPEPRTSGGSGAGDAAAFGFLVFGLTGIADEVGVEGETLVRKVVAGAVYLELSFETRVLGDTVPRDQVQNLSKGTTLEFA